MPHVLITGAGSGFGRLTAETLVEAGHTVAGTMRDTTGRNRKTAQELTDLGITVIDMDVTNDESVARGVEQAVAALGHLDVVVNNAGLGALGLAETFTPDDWQRIFAVNVFGVQRVTRAVVPHFRAQGEGLLLLISSMTAKLPIPFQGPYGSSKAAAESLAESYRLELPQFGIESAIIEPNGFRTEFLGSLAMADANQWRAAYGDFADMPAMSLKAYEQRFDEMPEHDPRLVADAVRDVIALPHGTRPFRTTVDRMGLDATLDRVNEFNESIRAELWTQMGVNELLTVR